MHPTVSNMLLVEPHIPSHFTLNTDQIMLIGEVELKGYQTNRDKGKLSWFMVTDIL